jgi:hypothetical protein
VEEEVERVVAEEEGHVAEGEKEEKEGKEENEEDVEAEVIVGDVPEEEVEVGDV